MLPRSKLPPTVDSKGRFLNAEVKGAYDYRRL